MLRKISYIGLVGLLVLFASANASAQIHDPRAIAADPATADGPIAPRLTGLGDYHYPVTTNSEDSQYFFDQGLRLAFAFNHSEALRAFKEATRQDPDNAMAYWGWALVLGPNLNLPMLPNVVPQAYGAIQQAVALSGNVSEKERRLIRAMALRYTDDPAADRTALDQAYSKAMGELVAAYPNDLTIPVFYAASLMNLSPWNYWYGDGSPNANTEELLRTLESIMDREPNHPGAIHYYIHAVEARHPKLAEAPADRLAALMPGAGHIVHMPSHIYMRVGRYADSYATNAKAAAADEDYITQCRAQGLYPLGYYPHNVHFQSWSAMFMGDRAGAMAAARKVADKVPADLADDTWLLYQTFLNQPLYTMVRFGMWQDILAEPQPRDDAMLLNAVWNYARGLAYANAGDLEAAAAELERIREIRRDPRSAEQSVGLNALPSMMAIAEEILTAEIARVGGDDDAAIAHLSRAVRLQDGLIYNEPPDWYFPVRHYLGAALLDAGYPDEAEVVYWQDLAKNPDNGFSLFGLAQALEAQGKTAEASKVEARFARAWKDADTMLTSSRF